MIATLLIIGIAFYWMLQETNWLTIRLPMGKVTNKTLIAKPITENKSVVALPVGNPDNYPITLTIDTVTLRGLIDQLSKTELELTEEYYNGASN